METAGEAAGKFGGAPMTVRFSGKLPASAEGPPTTTAGAAPCSRKGAALAPVPG